MLTEIWLNREVYMKVVSFVADEKKYFFYDDTNEISTKMFRVRLYEILIHWQWLRFPTLHNTDSKLDSVRKIQSTKLRKNNKTHSPFHVHGSIRCR